MAVLLPAHWQAAAVLLAAWWCGAEVVGEPAAAEWVLCDAGRVDPEDAAPGSTDRTSSMGVAAARAVKEGSNQYAPSRGISALREAVGSPGDTLFTMDVQTEAQVYHLSQRRFVLNARPHRLLLLKQLTRELLDRIVVAEDDVAAPE